MTNQSNQRALGWFIVIIILVMVYYGIIVYMSVIAGESKSISDLVLLTINSIYAPIHVIFVIIFFYCDSFLRTLSISMILILTMGKIFTLLKTNFWKAIKWVIYIWYFGYCLWSFGIFTNIFSLDALDWTTFMFSVLAPITMLIVGKQAGNIKIKGHKIFIYYVLMFLYLVIAVVWWLYYPNQVNFTVLAIYWAITLFFVVLIDYIL